MKRQPVRPLRMISTTAAIESNFGSEDNTSHKKVNRSWLTFFFWDESFG